MLHNSTSVAAGIPPPCYTLLHCTYEPGAHLSMLWLVLGVVFIGTLMLGVVLLLRHAYRGPETGWWRWTSPCPDDPRPPSPHGGATRRREAFEHSHRRRPRPTSVRHDHDVGSRSKHR
jgi:hypothetical protein